MLEREPHDPRDVSHPEMSRMKIVQEFRQFALKSSFIDLAVGVVLGAATGKVVSAIVDTVLMPPIGLATGRVNFKELKLVLQPAGVAADGTEIPEVAVGYGAAMQAVFELLAIAVVVFFIVRVYNRFRTVAAAQPAAPSAQEKLLAEIRDLLRAQQEKQIRTRP